MTTVMIMDLVKFAIQYGPQAAAAIAGLFDRANAGQPVTAADVAAVFASVKPYDAYGIDASKAK